ncbi:hypothetical protein CRUP_021238, partial [Coryphaenoides rupestris]
TSSTVSEASSAPPEASAVPPEASAVPPEASAESSSASITTRAALEFGNVLLRLLYFYCDEVLTGAHAQTVHVVRMKTVAVVGGGIGGLAAAYYLSKSLQVTKRADGAVFEHGPRGIRPAGAVGWNTLNLVQDIGLDSEILPVPYSHKASKNRFLYVNEKLHKMPSGIWGAFQTVSPFSRPIAHSVVKEVLVRRGKEDDESIHSRSSGGAPSYWACSWARDLPVQPGALAQRSRDESWAQWSLLRGMGALPEALADWLAQSGKVQLCRHAAVKKMHLSPSALASVLPAPLEPLSRQFQDISTVTVAVMMGGAWFQEVFGSPDDVSEEHLLAVATQAVRGHLGVTAAPSWSKVALQKNCIPQYYLGHWKRVESMRRYIAEKNLPLSLAGSSYDGVSVNDVIYSGRRAADSLCS